MLSMKIDNKEKVAGVKVFGCVCLGTGAFGATGYSPEWNIETF